MSPQKRKLFSPKNPIQLVSAHNFFFFCRHAKMLFCCVCVFIYLFIINSIQNVKLLNTLKYVLNGGGQHMVAVIGGEYGWI